jgi:hypothetical protein
MLKECSKSLLGPITMLFSHIARKAEWPKKWKEGRVSPTWKRDSRSIAKNYRPVTVLDNLSLAFERVVDPQFDSFLYLFIPENQFGFRKKCGTDDYGAALSAELNDALERLQEALLISLDVAGAFDKVWWKALLKNLRHCGMKGRAIKLMESYLSGRSLKVVVAGLFSELKESFAGVPQGAIWSPKLWNFHIRELSQVVKFCQLFKYADDSALLRIVEDIESRMFAVAEVNSDLEAISDWGQKWKVEFEPTKTHAIFFSRRPHSDKIDKPVMDGVEIGFVKSMKLVGFTFDSKLNWSCMLKSTASKGRSVLGALYRMKLLLKPVDLQMIYKSFVRSKMEYGMLNYMSAAPTHLAKLDRVQRTAEKICNCNFESLESRREAAVFSIICKLLDEECVAPLQKFKPVLITTAPEAVADRPKLRSRGGLAQGLRLECKQDKLRDFSLNNYKWSWQGQSARVFAKVPEDLLQRGAAGEWSDVRTSGKRELNGSAEKDRVKKSAQTKSMQKRLKKHQAQAAKVHGTGNSTVLTNELNANLANWEKYAAEWNAVKKNKANST